MKIKSQVGFGTVELLLAIIAVTLIVLTGFYVVNSGDSDDAKQTASSKPSSSSNSNSSKAQGYLELKELGVKIPLSLKTSADSFAEVAPTDDTIMAISTKAFQDAVGDCRASDTASASFPTIISVTKHTGTYNEANSFEQIGAYDSFGKQFDGFFLSYGSGDGGPRSRCEDPQSAAAEKLEKLFLQLKPQLVKGVTQAELL